jgi:hypothetical protein
MPLGSPWEDRKSNLQQIGITDAGGRTLRVDSARRKTDIEIFARLLDGDDRLAGRFAKCKKYWDAFFKAHENDSDEDLAKALGIAQAGIEQIFDTNRALGKEAMPITCFGSLYDPTAGWRDRERALARRLSKAFQQSNVSIEVKEYAEEAAKLYYVDE